MVATLKEPFASPIPSQPKKIGVYLRVSTEEQNNNTSKEAQLNSINKYITNEGWSEVPTEIYDDTHSASIISKSMASSNEINSTDALNISVFLRDELRRLIYDATLKSIDTVLVYSHDRLARNNYEALLIRHTLNKLGIGIIYTKPGEFIKSENDSINDFFENLLSNLATLESSIIGGRVFLGNNANITNSIWAGGPPPYGYNLIPNPRKRKNSILGIDDSKAIIVKNIFRLYNLGYTPEHIANYIKTTFPTHCDDVRWTKNTIKSILSNPTYLGTIVWNKKGGTRNPRRKNKSEYIYSNPNDRIKIIDKSTWDKTVHIKAIQNHNPKFLSTPFLLQGLIFCGECNKPLKCKNQGKALNNIYYCNHQNSKCGNSDKSRVKYDAMQLHTTVLNQLSTIIMTQINNSSSLQEIYEKYIVEFNNKIRELSVQSKKLSEAIDLIDNTMEKCSKQILALNNTLINYYDGDQKKEKKIILKCLDEFMTVSRINKDQLLKNLSLVNEKLKVSPKSHETFKNNILENSADFNKLITIKDGALRNRCIRLLFINLIEKIEVNKDSPPIISFK